MGPEAMSEGRRSSKGVGALYWPEFLHRRGSEGCDGKKECCGGGADGGGGGRLVTCNSSLNMSSLRGGSMGCGTGNTSARLENPVAWGWDDEEALWSDGSRLWSICW